MPVIMEQNAQHYRRFCKSVHKASEALHRCCRSRRSGCDRAPNSHNLPRSGNTITHLPRTAAPKKRTDNSRPTAGDGRAVCGVRVVNSCPAGTRSMCTAQRLHVFQCRLHEKRSAGLFDCNTGPADQRRTSAIVGNVQTNFATRLAPRLQNC